MSEGPGEDSDKSHEPSPQKLKKAREKGDVARSMDVSVAAGYAGLLLAFLALGQQSVATLGTGLMTFLDQPDRLASLVFEGSARPPMAGILLVLAAALSPWFAVPSAASLLSMLAQRGVVFAPSKVQPKSSRLSLLSNARNKFGRSGLFEFSKSFAKLVIFSVCLGIFLKLKLPVMIAAIGSGPAVVVDLMARLSVQFLFLAVIVAASIGALDVVWQHHEYRRKNRMSHKELTDETKESEGDPHIKQQRRFRGQEIAMNRMMSEIPGADVVIVNPAHYAVVLKWSRAQGSAPVCVAKGVDEMAAAIRKAAVEAAVPIHQDPPTARALHATVDLGQEISEQHFAPVAAAIRFADQMRSRAKESVT